jgi:riboflavin synthase
MFNGIIEEVGAVKTLEHQGRGGRLYISCSHVLSDLTPGASMAVNGVCLTATGVDADGFSADLSPETLERTSLGDLRSNERVNLERPLSLQTRLSGHIVQGHVDGTGTLERLSPLGNGNWDLQVRVPDPLRRFLVYKGSITIDGISLTIASVKHGLVSVAIIPHTYGVTNLSMRKPGDRVNIECDVIAKHVASLLDDLNLPQRI